MATVKMVSVSKIYAEHQILKNINLEIEKGQFVALVGPSGSGKSTLLRIVAGLEEATQGKVLINDQCVNQIPPAKRDMAMVFQSYALYPHMTVFSNMAYGLKMRRMDKNKIKKRVHEVSEMLQISDYLQRKPTSLSGGQRQRVAMGRAIVRNPAVFLFDEPLSNLDGKLRAEMRREIKKLHRELRTTSLYVTHDQTEAMTLADTIVILNNGKIEQTGTPQELYQKPSTLFVASFMGHFPMNFISARVDRTQNKLTTSIGLTLPLPKVEQSLKCGDDVVVCIRPEDISIVEKDRVGTIFSGRMDFIDDMGSDKLVQILTEPGKSAIYVRALEIESYDDSLLFFLIDLNKSSLFCQSSGRRIGGWA